MESFAKERDRLLQTSARAIGCACAVVALICLSIPGVLPPDTWILTLPLFALLVASMIRVGYTGSMIWAAVGVLSGLAIQTVVQLPLGSGTTPEVTAGLTGVTAAVASFAIVLLRTVPRIALLALSVVATTVLMESAVATPEILSPRGATVLVAWALAIVFASWLSASVPRAARRIYSIGRAHRAERQASETEAQRRQGARLLHDTVLATLTLLAHSGVGVSAQALQQQAGDDARLLRQLRLGGSPVPKSTEHFNVDPVEESALGNTLESVKQRFGRLGLEVSWHGTGQVLLPSDVLDAFLLALAECLENVRRHAGVRDAHVTITDDATTVRAMVTDAGVGFDIADIDAARLGFKDSVVGRLKEVGGNARLFSSPGAGTTVVLEVPR